MTELGLALVSGVLYGLSLLLTTIGLTLIFGVGRVVNFAHGAIYALGAFLGASATQVIGFPAAVVIVPIVVGLVAIILERILIRRLRRISEMTILLFTFGLGIVLEAVLVMIWGAYSYTVPMPAALSGSFAVLGGQVPIYAVFLAAVSLLTTGLLICGLHLTQFGLRVRAASEEPASAELAGVDVESVFTCVFGIGTGLAALSGVLVVPFVGASAGMAQPITVLVFIIVITGGLGSLPGTIIASILVGVIVTLGATYASSAAYLVLFASVIAVLLLRPYGLVASRSE